MKKYSREIKPHVSEFYDTCGRKCNDAAVNINSTEEFHSFHLMYLKEGNPSAMKLISEGPSTQQLTINRKITEKVVNKIQTS